MGKPVSKDDKQEKLKTIPFDESGLDVKEDLREDEKENGGANRDDSTQRVKKPSKTVLGQRPASPTTDKAKTKVEAKVKVESDTNIKVEVKENAKKESEDKDEAKKEKAMATDEVTKIKTEKEDESDLINGTGEGKK